MSELVQAVEQHHGRQRLNNQDLQVYTLENNAYDLHPVTLAESATYNLIVTTRKCQRIYLRLRTEPREECCDRLDEQRELESLGLQSDNLIVDKIIRGCWEVADTQSSLPEHNVVTQNPSIA